MWRRRIIIQRKSDFNCVSTLRDADTEPGSYRRSVDVYADRYGDAAAGDLAYAGHAYLILDADQHKWIVRVEFPADWMHELPVYADELDFEWADASCSK